MDEQSKEHKSEVRINPVPRRGIGNTAMKKEKTAQNLSNIAAQIKGLRKSIGLTQVEFAKRAGVGLRFTRELEQGKTTVRLDKLMQVLDFLGYRLELKRSQPGVGGMSSEIQLNQKLE